MVRVGRQDSLETPLDVFDHQARLPNLRITDHSDFEYDAVSGVVGGEWVFGITRLEASDGKWGLLRWEDVRG